VGAKPSFEDLEKLKRTGTHSGNKENLLLAGKDKESKESSDM